MHTYFPRRALLLCCASLTLLSPALANAQTVPAHSASAHSPAPIADLLTLSVDGRSLQLTPADLAAMPQTNLTVHNSHANTDEHYTGVALADLLARAGLPFAPGNEQRFFHSYLRAQGTDNYFVLYAGTELTAALHKGTVLVATRLNGEPLTRDGRFRMISPEDTRPARWVRNLTSLTLTTVN